MFLNVFNWISELFCFSRKDESLIGLSRLKAVKEPVYEVKKIKKCKDVKISDLMKGQNYY